MKHQVGGREYGFGYAVRVSALEDGFCAEDNGSGIPKDERDGVFE